MTDLVFLDIPILVLLIKHIFYSSTFIKFFHHFLIIFKHVYLILINLVFQISNRHVRASVEVDVSIWIHLWLYTSSRSNRVMFVLRSFLILLFFKMTKEVFKRWNS